jgi:hypothetical protein
VWYSPADIAVAVLIPVTGIGVEETDVSPSPN